MRGNRKHAAAALFGALFCLLVLGGCSVLPSNFRSDHPTQHFQLAPSLPAAGPAHPDGPVIAVAPPAALAPFNSQRMIYTERPYELNFFAYNDWADSPPRMLAPLLSAALERSGRFSAVVGPRSGVAPDLRLDTRLLALEQVFAGGSSRGRVVLRAQLVDNRSDRVLATRTFTVSRPAPSNDPRGGVAALNEAVQALLGQVVDFCEQATANLSKGG